MVLGPMINAEKFRRTGSSPALNQVFYACKGEGKAKGSLWCFPMVFFRHRADCVML